MLPLTWLISETISNDHPIFSVAQGNIGSDEAPLRLKKRTTFTVL